MNGQPLFSTHWHRVQDVKPRLVGDLRVSQQLFRGMPSFLLHRRSSKDYHRLDSLAYELVARFDGQTSVGAIWENAQETHGDEAPTQPGFLQLLAALHEADLIVTDRDLDAERLFRRGETQARQRTMQRLANPLYLRFKLVDPHRWLQPLTPLIKPAFTRKALVVWLGVMLVALVQLLPNTELLITEFTVLDLLSPTYLAGFLVVYVLMKLLHELAHALCVEHYGGEVHELGIALMVLLPNPYTDASAATFFPSKRQRMLVSAAGVITELTVAAVGALLWTVSEGMLHDVALMMLLTGSLSTLLFNANPLLKFDGYYLLADWLEIPNLAERSRRYLTGRAAHYLLRLPDTHPPPTDANEKRWLLGYGVVSGLYRIGLIISIAWLVSGQYFFFGLLLAAYALASLMLFPAWRLARYIHRLPPRSRGQGAAILATMAASTAGILLLLPLPRSTVAEGVVWLPEQATLRVAHRCDVTEVLIPPGSNVVAGTPLLYCQNAELDAHRRVARSRVQELQAQKAGLATRDPARYRLIEQQLSVARGELAQFDEEKAGELITSRSAGQFLIDGQQQLAGRHFLQGDIIGYVVPAHERTVRVALTQDEIALVSQETASIDVVVRQHLNPFYAFTSRVLRQTPKPTDRPVSAALTTQGGARLAATRQGSELALDEPVFDVELSWPDTAPPTRAGGRVQVKFRHEAAPLAGRIVAGVRRALMQRARS